jgi:oxalate decarboxylase/phosphoglucose isomerase-like protein (cupin superfamily)
VSKQELQMDFSNVPKHLATRTHEEMKKVLMDPEATGPAVHYYMIRGGKDQRNVTVWEPGTVGVEYIKTFGHYHVGDLEETYWVVEGEGVLLQQKLSGEDPSKVAEFKAQIVKAGDNIHIPSGYGHLVANTGSTFLVSVDDSPVDFTEADPVSLPGHADYAKVEQMHGFAYYIVEKDGRPALVKNPHYSEVGSVDAGGLEVVE